MKLQAITSNYSVNYSNRTPYTTKAISEPKYKQNNELVDMNYGASLVLFKGAGDKAVYSLSDKVSATFAVLDPDDILLVGKDLASIKNDFAKSANEFKFLIRNAVVIFAQDIAGTLAIRRQSRGSNVGYDYLYNLSDNKLAHSRRGSDVSTKYLGRGENGYLRHLDSFSFLNDKSDIVLDEYYRNPKDVYDAGGIWVREFPAVDKINTENIMKTKYKETVESDSSETLTLASIGGQDEAVKQLKQKVLFPIQYPKFFKNNLKGLNSALLVGPPGTGKTLAAMALANEAGVPFFNMNGQLLESKYVGETAQRINAYYEKVKQSQPCILFFDEADAIFGKRTGEYKHADESVNMHLDQISELEKQGSSVFLLAATNHPELIDDAVLRNGRFGTKIEFKAPDTEEKCVDIFNIHTKNTNLENIDKELLGKRMLNANFNGADIAALVDEAKMAAIARQGIFDQMEKGTYEDTDDFRITLNNFDFNAAIEKLISNKKVLDSYDETSHRVAGFNPEL